MKYLKGMISISNLIRNFKSKLVFKIFFHFLVIILIFIFLLSAGIACMYKSFVVSAKERQILKIYQSLKTSDAKEIADEIDDINFSHNIRIFILDEQLKPVNDIQFFPERIFLRESVNLISKYKQQLDTRPYVFYDDLQGRKPPDTMEFIGKLDSGGYIFATLSYSFVRENIGYSISFIIMFSVIAVILCAIVSYILAKRICKPIINISEITKKMAWLDFSEKCDVISEDELGTLAVNVNFLSEQLEENINELRAEIEKERKIDEMRKNLIINVSHELKTPIFLVQSYAEGLKENVICNDKDRLYYCNVIEDEAKRMDIMVKELLSLAKLESGKENVDFSNFSLAELIEEVLEIHSITISNKNIKLVNSTVDFKVTGDRKLLNNAFSNLFINAIDYTNQGGEIKVYSEELGDKIRVYVYNSGSHIVENEKEKIWESFYKVDKSRKRGYGGTGIGLSIVKAVMDTHNTGYGVRNTDSGVEFYIEFKKV